MSKIKVYFLAPSYVDETGFKAGDTTDVDKPMFDKLKEAGLAKEYNPDTDGITDTPALEQKVETLEGDKIALEQKVETLEGIIQDQVDTAKGTKSDSLKEYEAEGVNNG